MLSNDILVESTSESTVNTLCIDCRQQKKLTGLSTARTFISVARRLYSFHRFVRITCISPALPQDHPYLAEYHRPDSCTRATEHFRWQWDSVCPDVPTLRQLFWREMAHFHPEMDSLPGGAPSGPLAPPPPLSTSIPPPTAPAPTSTTATPTTTSSTGSGGTAAAMTTVAVSVTRASAASASAASLVSTSTSRSSATAGEAKAGGAHYGGATAMSTAAKLLSAIADCKPRIALEERKELHNNSKVGEPPHPLSSSVAVPGPSTTGRARIGRTCAESLISVLVCASPNHFDVCCATFNLSMLASLQTSCITAGLPTSIPYSALAVGNVRP